jgi:hypothetical protein
VNRSVDNIGARRLHTVLERVVEDISFHAPERAGDTYTVDKEVSYVVFIWPLWHVLWYLSIFSSQSGLLKLLPIVVTMLWRVGYRQALSVM